MKSEQDLKRAQASEAWGRIRLGSVDFEADWESLYRYLWPQLVAVNACRFGAEAAQEGAQQTLLWLAANRTKYSQMLTSLDALRVYSSAVAKNKIVDSLRRASKFNSIDVEAENTLVAPEIYPDLGMDVDKLLNNKDLLSNRDRELLLMLIAELPVSEIAYRLNLKQNAAYVVIHRLRERLKSLVGLNPKSNKFQ